jgi:hypothetical protein
MSMTLLQLVQAAAGEMGLPQPSAISGNSSQDVVQYVALINKLGRDLATDYVWQALDVEYRFTTSFLATTGDITTGSAAITNIPSTASLDATYMLTGTGVPQDCTIQSVNSATQVTMDQPMTTTAVGATLTFCKTKYALPAPFLKPVNNTQWDKTRHWVMLGPATPQMWQWLKSGYIATGPRIHYRILGNYFQIWPMVPANEYLGFEYLSAYWAYTSGGAAAASMSMDDDTCIYRDNLMIAGLKKCYWEAKGFESSAYDRDYQGILSSILATEKGGKILRMGGRPSNILINQTNIPDSGYGL